MRYYIYQQPIPGRTTKGEEVTCTQFVIVSEEDVIAIRREIERLSRKDSSKYTDEGRLEDFKSVHWATECYGIVEACRELQDLSIRARQCKG